MSKEQNFCIFCGGTGLTKEHIFPDWLKKVIPQNASGHGQALTGVVFKKDKILISPNLIKKQGHLGQRKARRVCEKCNNGWMSTLQQTVKPELVSMISGNPIKLGAETRIKISSWVVMTSIMAEFLDTLTAGIPSSDRQVFKDTMRPPPNWSIWLGHNKGPDDFRYYHHGGCVVKGRDMEKALSSVGAPFNSQFSTFIFGELLIHAASGPPGSDFEFGKEFDDQLVRLWEQFESVMWPPLSEVTSHLPIGDYFLHRGRDLGIKTFFRNGEFRMPE